MMSHKESSMRKTPARLLAIVMIVSLLVCVFPAVALAATADNSTITGAIPAMVAGQSYTVKITVKNTGTTTWTAAGGYKLVCTAGAASFGNKASYPVPSSVKPKASVTFTVVMTAPLKKTKVSSAWQMSKGSKKFGKALKKTVSVTIAAQNSLVVSASAPSTMTTSKDFQLTVTFKNTGSSKWTNKDKYTMILTYSFAHPIFGKFSVQIPFPLTSKDSIAFGSTKTFSIPDNEIMEGDYTFTCQMACGGKKFGAVITKKVHLTFSSKDLLDCTDAYVTNAEENPTQANVNAAQYFINEMAAGSDKTKLQARLDAVQESIDLPALKAAAQTAVVNAYAQYNSGDYSDVNWNALKKAASDGYNNIQESTTKAEIDTAKTNAINGMVAVKTLAQEANDAATAATAAVATAEGSNLQADVTAARALVNALPAGVVKTSLGLRLDAVQAIIDLPGQKVAAKQALADALSHYSQDDYSTDNWTALNKAKTDGDKDIDAATSLAQVNAAQNAAQMAMDAVKNKVDQALSAVVQAEQSALQADKDAAESLVGLLPDGGYKTVLQARLNDVQNTIDLNSAKAGAHQALNGNLTTLGESNYSQANWQVITNAKIAGDDAIDNATSISDVNTAQANAIAAMAAVPKIA